MYLKRIIRKFNVLYFYLYFIGLLNLRGNDISNNPVFFSYVILTEQSVDLYLLNKNRVATPEIQKHFTDEGIEINIFDYETILNGIEHTVSKIFFFHLGGISKLYYAYKNYI